MKKLRSLSAVLLVLMLLTVGNDLLAQCPMCRSSVESSLKEGGKTGMGLNDGILYLLAFPYILVATVGIIWYRKFRARKIKAAQG